MLESIFVLAVIYLAYLMTRGTANASVPQAVTDPAKPSPLAMPSAVVAQNIAAPVTATLPKPLASKSKIKPRKLPSTKPAPIVVVSKQIKNPLTGETTAYTSYRFAKRWLKDALVSEGLLDKVYKNNELDSSTEAHIKTAVNTLSTLAAYQD